MKHLKMLGLSAVAIAALLAVVGAGTASATTLYVGGVKQTEPREINATLETGTLAILKDTNNVSVDECPGSTVAGKDSTKFTGAEVEGPVSSLSFVNCTHTTHVIKPGKLSVAWINGTHNGTVKSYEAEVTIVSTVFGASCTAKTGTGTVIGTITGKTGTTEHATMDINAVISMGLCSDANWTGSYIVTSPTGLSIGE